MGRADESAMRFTSSFEADRRLAWAVKRINEAHMVMLASRGIVREAQASKILAALRSVDVGDLDPGAEDIHTAIELAVITQAGLEAGGNLHLAKSRNDQVATAIRMELRKELLRLSSSILDLLGTLVDVAGRNLKTIIPAFTHTQAAQPTTYAHYLLCQFDIFRRDFDRIGGLYERVNKSPMGSGAVVGTSFPISREEDAELLGFEGLVENTMDGVGSRDFCVEALSLLAILATDLSRLATDFILWSGLADIMELPDELSGTSSIMPQKKNPDALELMRAKAGLAIGNLVSALTVVKGLPSSYNLDFQEITPRLWETIDQLHPSLELMSKVIAGSKIRPGVAEEMADVFTTFSELANVLARNHGVPFRVAHKIIGSLTKRLYESKLSLEDVTAELIGRTAKETAGVDVHVTREEVNGALAPDAFVKSHSVRGGPSAGSLSRMIEEREDDLKQLRGQIGMKEDRLSKAGMILDSRVSACSRG